MSNSVKFQLEEFHEVAAVPGRWASKPLVQAERIGNKEYRVRIHYNMPGGQNLQTMKNQVIEGIEANTVTLSFNQKPEAVWDIRVHLPMAQDGQVEDWVIAALTLKMKVSNKEVWPVWVRFQYTDGLSKRGTLSYPLDTPA